MMKKSTIYFVSSLNGNDENDGLSESTAFKSLNKINEIDLIPGDNLEKRYFKCFLKMNFCI